MVRLSAAHQAVKEVADAGQVAAHLATHLDSSASRESSVATMDE